jgi:asparagine synthase (glutamine-hydrolysing)
MAETTSAPLRTFSLGFDVAGHSETDYARLMAQRYGTHHHEHTIGVESLATMLPRVLWMHDEPHADASAIPTHAISAAASREVKVLLSGDGGDEVFAGYTWYAAWLAREAIDQLPLGPRRRVVPWLERYWPQRWPGRRWFGDLSRSPLERYARLMELFPPDEKRRLLAPDWARQFEGYDDYWHFRQHWREDLDPITRLQYVDLKTYLPGDILTKVDRASMAASVEVRPPLLDHVLVEQVLGLPSSCRVPDGRSKWLLKETMRERLPPPILNRRKKGFSVPMNAWMKTSRAWAEAELRSGAATGWWRLPEIEAAPWFGRGLKVWAVLLLQRWFSSEGTV